MASKDLSDQLKDLTLEAVIPQNKQLGRGERWLYTRMLSFQFDTSSEHSSVHGRLLY